MDAPFRLLTPPSSSSSSYTTRSSHHRMLRTPPPPTFSSLRNIPHRICFAKKPPWDSNAESFRKRKFYFSYGDDEEDDTDEMYDSWIQEGSGFVDKVIDDIFIFKVLKSYGWMLPFMIISLLLVSGPKAFLLALGLAIGLSLIAYAFQNIFGETQSSPGSKFKRKKRSPTASKRSNINAKPDNGSRTRRKGSTVSWATKNDNSAGKRVQGKPFGGWDELDEAVDYTVEPVKMPDQTKVDLNEVVESMSEPVKMPGQTRVRSELNRMNRRRREMGRTPLLLRLLIASFPFLSLWIKLL